MKRALRIMFLIAMVIATFAAPNAGAQIISNNIIRIISANPPGGMSDPLMRAVIQALSKGLGVTAILEHRPGADGLLMGEQCARSNPNGLTLCMGDPYSFTLNSVTASKMPFDHIRDFVPIIHLGYLPAGLWASAKLPVESVADLIGLVQRKPGTVTWASFSTSSAVYLQWLSQTYGLQFNPVPYRSAVDAWRAVLGGESDVAAYALRSGLTQIENIPNPQMRPKLLAVNTEARLADLPDTPTFRQAGIAEVTGVWFGLFAPVGTPTDLVQKYNRAIKEGLFDDKEMREKYLDKLGLVVEWPAGEPSAEFVKLMKSEKEKYERLVAAAKYRKE
jgi:tripartite-type tricarboxylate transporter receptor subunit TctC